VTHPRPILAVNSLLLTGLLGLAGGCESKVSTANDDLRARVLELEQSNEQLRRREAELLAELEVESRRPDSLSPEIRASVPHVADIAIGRLSHARDSDDDGVPDRLTLYVDPADGLGRFTQMVGTLSAHAVFVPADADAITIGRVTLGPAGLREAYRSSLTGAHYTVELTVAVDAAQALEPCLVRVRFEDGLTGAVHTAEREIALRR
jgi:hypothetical protein